MTRTRVIVRPDALQFCHIVRTCSKKTNKVQGII